MLWVLLILFVAMLFSLDKMSLSKAKKKEAEDTLPPDAAEYAVSEPGASKDIAQPFNASAYPMGKYDATKDRAIMSEKTIGCARCKWTGSNVDWIKNNGCPKCKGTTAKKIGFFTTPNVPWWIWAINYLNIASLPYWIYALVWYFIAKPSIGSDNFIIACGCIVVIFFIIFYASVKLCPISRIIATLLALTPALFVFWFFNFYI